MTNDDTELVRGSGNVYRDFGRAHAGLAQARAITAARLIRILDERQLSTQDAERLTGVANADFARIRNAQLRHFTLDRLISIIEILDEDVEIDLTFHPRRRDASTS
jgi:predicted XRE-type DNA-binding protein